MRASATIRTVIVDDDPAVQRLHTAYLAAVEGFSLVGVARTGAAAAELVTRTGVDFVLLDMNLPDFSGIEVLHRLRIVRDWQVDVLVVSSARDTTTVRQALSAHVIGYLVKPFTKEAFVQRLEQYRNARGERPAEAGQPLGQGDIDALAAGRRAGAGGRRSGAGGSDAEADGRPGAVQPASARDRHDADLPKGLSPATLEVVLAALDPVQAASARDVADRSGASVPTVRRYLDHLTRTGDVTVSHRFGARGRPEVLYRLAVG